MPRFFFHLHNGEDVPDREGLELPDREAAHGEAIRNARSIMAEEIMEGNLPLRDVIEVVDESGAAVMTVSFRDAVEIDE